MLIIWSDCTNIYSDACTCSICCESVRIHFSGIDSLCLLLDRAVLTGCCRCLRPPCPPRCLPCVASQLPEQPVQRNRNIRFFPSIAGIRRNHVRGGRRNSIKRGTAGKTLSKSDCLACFANVSNFGADGRAPTSGKLISHELTCFSSPNPYKRCYRQGCLLQIVGCLNTTK